MADLSESEVEAMLQEKVERFRAGLLDEVRGVIRDAMAESGRAPRAPAPVAAEGGGGILNLMMSRLDAAERRAEALQERIFDLLAKPANLPAVVADDGIGSVEKVVATVGRFKELGLLGGGGDGWIPVVNTLLAKDSILAPIIEGGGDLLTLLADKGAAEAKAAEATAAERLAVAEGAKADALERQAAAVVRAARAQAAIPATVAPESAPAAAPAAASKSRPRAKPIETTATGT